MSPALFEEGLSISADLDARFGRKTVAAKMTDVPGHTLGMVPLLARAGVRFLHLGVNAASPVPDVPPVFRWQAPDGSEVVVMYQSSYGEMMVPEGMQDGIAFAHTNDNAGPQSVPSVVEARSKLAAAAPGHQIKAARLDDFWQTLEPHVPDLPVITDEIGDTWIHGTASAPKRIARFVPLVARFDAMPAGPVRSAFGRKLMEVAEHTWGMDIKTYLRDTTAWDRPAFDQARQTDPRFAITESSWAEQDALIDAAIALLPEPDRAEATTLPAPPAVATGPIPYGPVQCGSWIFGLDGHGGLTNLARDGVTLLKACNGGALFTYEQHSFTASDMDRYLDSYLTQRIDWALLDHGKPGLEHATTSRSGTTRPTLIACESEPGQVTILAEMPHDWVRDQGAPIHIRTLYAATDTGLDVTLHLQGKAANRQPEAGLVLFQPDMAPGSLRLEKLGLTHDPRSVVVDGNRQLHGVSGVTMATLEGQPIRLDLLSSRLVHLSSQPFLDHSRGLPDPDQGIGAVLFTNKWGTNFSMWCEGDLTFRFRLTLG
jgi:hypothetical protein